MKVLRSILIVADNPADSFFVELTWEPTGRVQLVNTIHASERALEALRDPEIGKKLFNGRPLPDLVLLDLNMPRVDGFQFLEALPNFGAPIVVLTGSIDPLERERALKLGAADVLRKPVLPQDAHDLAEKFGHAPDPPQ